ncbi:hypothetical protein BDB01DRAFT_849801 [Pilobolus umbonatus]|nr:hypothetical protein BDB01DRAFT_849801 [Pilobolus umbonatus]
MGNTSLPYEIVHCSSWDDDYSPDELVKSSPGNQIEPLPSKCKGWQTPKCPDYPQDIIIHLLSGTARISKIQVLSHHFKIATKIDIYVGLLKDAEDILDEIAPDTPPSDDEDNTLIEFTRLGYVCFDNNARAQYRARELKSIKMNADGEYIRLVIRNCHRNRLNTYNQVGILALNILGQPLHLLNHTPRHLFDDNSMLSSSTRRTSVSSNQSTINRQANAGLVEIELLQWTTALHIAEEEAVKGEGYQSAKTYKYLGDKLEKLTKILSDLEIGKKHAVDTKDYDEAEKIKDDIKEIKQAAEMMLKHACIEITPDGRVIQLESAIQLAEIPTSDHHHHQLNYPHTSPMEMTETIMPEKPNEKWKSSLDMSSTQINSNDQYNNMTYPEEIDPESIPEPIMDEERGPYTLAIRVLGEEIVASVLSIKAKCRGRGLGLIEKRIESAQQMARNNEMEEFYLMHEVEDNLEMDPITQSVADFVNAVLMMIQEAVMDSREPIVSLAISTWHQLNEFSMETNIEPRWIIEWTEHTFSSLLKRTGDSNTKIKTSATSLVFTLIQSYSIHPYSLMPLFICKPDRMIHNYKEAKCRIELVEATIMKLGIEVPTKKKVASSSSNKKSVALPQIKVPLDDVMAFVVAYLNHVHEEARKTAVKLVVAISDQIGFNLVSRYIDEKLRLSLAETVKKLVDEDSFYNKPSNKRESSHSTKILSELRALALQPEKKPITRTTRRSTPMTADKRSVTADRRSVTADKRPVTTDKRQPAKAKKTTAESTLVNKSSRNSKIQEKAEGGSKIAENSVCIFCDEVNPDFNEDTLIKHYYNACPVLTNCPLCQIITEVSTLNEHMLIDCERRHLIKECSRCKQPVLVEQWLQHSLKQTCDNMGEHKVNCPLCLVNINPPDESGWKIHLLMGDGCPKLRQSRLSKQPKKKIIPKK